MADKAANAYRTISEAGQETGLPAHVLRFWESKFSQLRPVKRAGGRRLYRPQDISLILGLKHLLYEEGFTIKGAQKYIKDHGVAELVSMMEQGEGPSLASPAADASDGSAPAQPSDDAAPGLFDAPAPTASAGRPLEAGEVARLIAQLQEAKAALDGVRKSANR